MTDSHHADKWETIRRRRLWAIKTLAEHRCRSAVLSDDDAGRAYLWALLCCASLAPSGADKKMKNIIETRAPWIPEDEAQALIDHLNRLPLADRNPSSRALGEFLGVKNVERQRLRLWPIKPFDMSDEQLAEQRRATDRERSRERRRLSRMRQSYEDNSLSRLKPWEAENPPVSRRTWYRRRRGTSASAPIVLQGLDGLVPPPKLRGKKGHQKKGYDGVKDEKISEVENAERTETERSPELRTHLCQAGGVNG